MKVNKKGLEDLAIDLETKDVPTSLEMINKYASLTCMVFNIEPGGKLWNFLFSPEWEEADPSNLFTATRIRLYLKMGVPDKWEYTKEIDGIWVEHIFKKAFFRLFLLSIFVYGITLCFLSLVTATIGFLIMIAFNCIIYLRGLARARRIIHGH